MNYLFFDIECCDGAHICSFGYVITNSKFEILEKNDILINPQWRFRKGRDGFDTTKVFSISKNDFKKLNPFTYYYEYIKNMLCNKNYVLLGHTVNSDINFVRIACERYALDVIKCEAYDTQNFYYQLNPKYPSRSLHNIVADLGIETDLVEHKSCDDAELSMLVTKEICSRLNLTIDELILLCDDSKRDGEKKTQVKNKNYFKRQFEKIANKYPNRNKFPAICFSDAIIENDIDGRLRLIKKIFDKGFDYTTKVSECQYFVKGILEGDRDEYCHNYLGIKKISIEDLSNMLNVYVNDFGEIEEDFNSEMYEALKSSLLKKGLTYNQWKNLF